MKRVSGFLTLLKWVPVIGGVTWLIIELALHRPIPKEAGVTWAMYHMLWIAVAFGFVMGFFIVELRR